MPSTKKLVASYLQRILDVDQIFAKIVQKCCTNWSEAAIFQHFTFEVQGKVLRGGHLKLLVMEGMMEEITEPRLMQTQTRYSRHESEQIGKNI